MCSPATCRSCGKVTYSGCGMHVDHVLRGIAPENLSELGQTSAHRLAVADPSARERRPAEGVLAPSRELVGCADR